MLLLERGKRRFSDEIVGKRRDNRGTEGRKRVRREWFGG